MCQVIMVGCDLHDSSVSVPNHAVAPQTCHRGHLPEGNGKRQRNRKRPRASRAVGADFGTLFDSMSRLRTACMTGGGFVGYRHERC